MKKTAQSIRIDNDGVKLTGEITCEVTGEWSNGIKCWTEIGEQNGNQYSLMRKNGKFLFVLEAVN